MNVSTSPSLCPQYTTFELHFHIMYFNKRLINIITGLLAYISSQQISQDPGIGGVPIEIVHLYNNEYP